MLVTERYISVSGHGGRELMDLEDHKKVLIVVGMDQQFDNKCMKKMKHFSPEEVIILKSIELDGIEPFGDLMRDILIQVYQRNVEEILIVEPKEKQKNLTDVLGKIENNIQLKKNIRTLDYLFTFCDPEFPVRSMKEWLEGNHLLVEGIQHTIDVIRRHPLMPPSVKVTELK